jgi:choline dehydrogenase-like flavoprotein
LIVEYGYLDNDQSVLEPSRGFPAARNMYNLTSLPQAGLNNRRNQIFSAAVVGGGSAVNGMFGDRGAAIDYDNWEALGNPGWGFQGLLPYFKKVRCRPDSFSCWHDRLTI